jgi:metallo-beta-lactamase family protein
LKATLSAQGHILGAAAVNLEFEGLRLTLSGDIGRHDDPMMLPPVPPPASDWIVTESTYGNRRHAAGAVEEELRDVLLRTLARQGVVVMPAFAVGRAQLLLHIIAKLQEQGAIPEVPVYLNSPMATDVSALYRDYGQLHRLGQKDLDAMRAMTRLVTTPEQSKALNRRKGPMIIVSASGMATGGRVLHHLIAFAPDPRNAIVLSGFQAGGTRGAALAGGARSLRIFGEDVAVKAEVVQLGSASSHADADEILAWLRSAPRLPRRIFITHGEPDAADALRVRIERELGVPAHVPEYRETVDLRRDAESAAAR